MRWWRTPRSASQACRNWIALAKAKPEQIFFGSSGVGTSTHLSGELFNQMAGVKLVHVPYPGSAQAIADVLTGRIALLFSPASTIPASTFHPWCRSTPGTN